jgi:CO dehydrogenase maturation factor
MRISFLGKGGSGKTTTTAAFVKYLSKKYAEVLAIDADLNIHLQKALQIQGETQKLGNKFTEISDYLKGNRKLNTEMIGTTPPSLDSQFILPNQEDSFIRKYTLKQDNISLLTVGSYEHADLGATCYHGKLMVLESIFHHMLDKKEDWVIADATAGVDNLGTSLFFAYDLNIFVVEPTIKSIQVFKDFLKFSDSFNLKTMCIVNKYEPEDEEFIKNNLDTNLILGKLPKSNNVKKFEQGDNQAFESYVLECAEAFENIEKEVGKTERDWNFYLKNLIQVHQKNSQTWYNSYYSQDLETQIENDFDYEKVI